MKRSGELVRRTPLARRVRRLNPVSRKRLALLRQRSEFRRHILTARPLCEIRITGAPCRNRSTDVHEILTRARMGSILDARNVLALCRACHGWVHAHPLVSAERGWLMNSWMKRED